MTNLDKIRKAWAMGWSATLYSKEELTPPYVGHAQILRCSEDGWVTIGYDIAEINLNEKECEAFKITGYLYAGELAGNEPIPEGQIFKSKCPIANVIWVKDNENHGDRHDEITLKNEAGGYDTFNKSEIEPIFENPNLSGSAKTACCSCTDDTKVVCPPMGKCPCFCHQQINQ